MLKHGQNPVQVFNSDQEHQNQKVYSLVRDVGQVSINLHCSEVAEVNGLGLAIELRILHILVDLFICEYPQLLLVVSNVVHAMPHILFLANLE